MIKNKMNQAGFLLSSPENRIASGRFDYVYILKFIAIILITNSHFKPVYEGALCQYAFGGAMGCSIFFFVSGYTLAFSNKGNLLQWVIKRSLRIYPAIWLFYIFTWTPIKWYYIFWPHLWFLQAMIVFYILFYFCSKYCSKYYMIIVVLLIFPYLIIYHLSSHDSWIIDNARQPYKIHWVYYFSFMLIGAWLRTKLNNRSILLPINKTLALVLCLMAFLITYGLKFACDKQYVPMDFQLVFPILLILTVLAFLITTMNITLSDNMISQIVRWIADRTLELFIVQGFVISCFKTLHFPIRFLVVVTMIFVSAAFLHWITNITVNYLKQHLEIV